MRFFEKIYQSCSNFNYKLKGVVALVVMASIGLSGCDDSSGGSTGHFKFYNAAPNSPAVFIEIENSGISGNGFEYGEGTSRELQNDNYELELSWEEDDFDYEVFYGGDNEENLAVKKDRNTLLVLASVDEEDTDSPADIVEYEYVDERDELTDDEDDDEFAISFINLYSDDIGIDVYYAEKDQSFSQAILFGGVSYQYKDMSETLYIERDNYVFYITEAGSNEVLYESDEQLFQYRSQYVMFVKANTGPGDSPYTVDKMYTNGAIDEYPDVDASAELRFYNAMIGDVLYPTYTGAIDVNVINAAGEEELIENIVRQEFSDVKQGNLGDLNYDIYEAGTGSVPSAEPLEENYYLGVQANDDLTVFLYTTIVRDEDDRDPDTIELREEYIDQLIVANSATVSEIEHNITVVNFIDDYSLLRVAFVRDDETAVTATNYVQSTRGSAHTLNLQNDTYTVQVVYVTDSGNSTVKTLVTKVITLDEDSKDMFLIIEGNEVDEKLYNPPDGSQEVPYTINFVEQNNN